VDSGITFTLNALTIAHGNFEPFGGGIYNDSGSTVSINNSTFANNSAPNGFGGGSGTIAAR
jgi:hypothetical protein